MSDEFADRRLTAADERKVGGRLGEPQGQQTCSRWCLRPVDGLQQRAFARAAGSGEELEVAGRSGVEEDGVSELRLNEAEKILGAVAERVGDIAEHRTGGAQCRMFLGQAETRQPVDGKRLCHEPGTGGAVEVPARQTGDRPAL